MKKLFLLVMLFSLLAAGFPVGSVSAQAAIPPELVSPGLCQVKTDMQLPWVGTLPVNYHSRTRLPLFSHIPGGITPATIRLYGGVGNVQLSPAWLDFVERINSRNQIIINYLFHSDSGWQNSDQRGRIEELVFEGQLVNVLRVSGNKAYVQTFSVDQLQPLSSSTRDPRIQLFTIVTRDDQLIGTPKGQAYIILIARRGEQLWIPTNYLSCLSRLPKRVQITTYPSNLNIRSAPAIGDNRVGSYAPGSFITILETFSDSAGNVWGRTDLGWVALKYGGSLLTDWGL